MARFLFESRAAYDPVAGAFASNAGFRFYDEADATFSTPLVVYDLSGASSTSLQVGAIPAIPDFYADDRAKVRWRSGQYSGILVSYDYLVQLAGNTQSQAVSAAQASAASAASAAAAAQASAAAAGNTSGGAGLSTSALDTYVGGSLANFVPGRVAPRLRVSGGTGAWESRPTCKVAVTIGIAPKPSDMADNDLFFEVPA